MAASVTTVDVLAAYGKQLHAVVPAQIGFSRGADGIVVRSDIKRINQLKGKTIATAQFTEVDFFIRYLAQEAGLPINMLGSLDAAPHPERLNLVYTEDGFGAGDLFLNDIKSGKNRLAGCVTWEPKVSEVVDGSGGQAHVLATNRNLLIIADVLIVHRGFAQEQPKIVEGLVQGLLEGNRMVRDRPDQYLDVVGRVVQVEPRRHQERAGERPPVEPAGEPRVLLRRDRRRRQLREHLSVGRARLRQRPDQGSAGRRAGSPASRALQAIEKSGLFKDQKVAIAPIRSGGGAIARSRSAAQQGHPVPLRGRTRRRSIMANQENLKNLEAIKRLLQVSPGSTLLLRGHVDNAKVEEFRRKGGEALVRTHGAARDGAQQGPRGRRSASCWSSATASTPKRIEVVGRGWEEPAGPEFGSEPARRSAVVHDRVVIRSGVRGSGFGIRRICCISKLANRPPSEPDPRAPSRRAPNPDSEETDNYAQPLHPAPSPPRQARRHHAPRDAPALARRRGGAPDQRPLHAAAARGGGPRGRHRRRVQRAGGGLRAVEGRL